MCGGGFEAGMHDILAYSRGNPITVEDVVTYLKVTGAFGNAVYKLMEMHTIDWEIQSLNVQITEEALQAHLTAKRRVAGLTGAADLNNYCHRNGILWEQWMQVAESELRRNALKQRVIGSPAIQAYFEHNRERLKKVCVARIVCHTLAEAEQIRERLLAGESDFATLARQTSLEHNSRIAGGHLGCMGRGVLPPNIEQDIFFAEAGALCGPYAQNGFWAIYMVEEVLHSTLTDSSMYQIADKLFADWLRERVLKAQREERMQGEHYV